MKFSNNQQAFLELVRAGLWEKEAYLLPYGDIDFEEIYRLAQEQTVVGLVAAGLEHVVDVKSPKETLFAIVGDTLQLEQRNLAMNDFIGVLVEKMRDNGVYSLLLKGQGVAQCYERSLWRSSGDIDFLLDNANYKKAYSFFTQHYGSSISDSAKNNERLHSEFIVGPWVVELHGTVHANLTKHMDCVLDTLQNQVFTFGEVRSWRNGEADIFLPSPDFDVLFVFSHILQHLFLGGIGLRQICDLCRLVFFYKESISVPILDERLRDMKVLTEWKVIESLIVDYLGFPQDAMPLYDNSYKTKAKKLLMYIFLSGNFGCNRDFSYYDKYPTLIRKLITFGRQVKESFYLSRIFPIDSFLFLRHFFKDGITDAVKRVNN